MKKLTSSYLGLLLLVILFGAFVRASGSGAGCGNHWPLCNGELIPLAPNLKMIIEFSHRITSGICIPFGWLLVWFLYKKKKQNDFWSNAFRWAIITQIFLVIEAMLGAGLVIWEHVAENKSNYRAVSMSLHLINTFFLTASAMLTIFWSIPPSAPEVNAEDKMSPIPSQSLWIGLFLIILTGVSGAITALGDTLFPVSSTGEAIIQSMNPGVHLLITLRIYHPFLAIFTGVFLVFISRQYRATSLMRVSGGTNSWLVLFQIYLGFLNIYLAAPIWMQLVHLLVAQGVWLSFVFYTAAVFSHARKSVRMT